MNDWQPSRELSLFVQGQQFDLKPSVSVERVKRLTSTSARRLAARSLPPTAFIIAARADAEALAFLRAEGRSYLVEEPAEVYVAPEIDSLASKFPPAAPASASRNPFATRASRISRLLLLHPETDFTIQDLSSAAKVDKSLTSRTINALASAGLVTVAPGSDDERFRYVHLNSARRLLEEWQTVWRRRPLREARHLDIGTRSVAATLRAVAGAASEEAPYAISGLAGAQFVKRAVEPGDVLLLTTQDAILRWMELLFARPVQRGEGLLRVRAVADDFVLRLAEERDGVVVADAVQLWLDTSTAGERAQEASEAIAEAMHW